MQKQLILNPAQAEAVYSAMCALNNVSGRLAETIMPGSGTARFIVVVDHGKNGVRIASPTEFEHYAGQHELATAYGLNADAASTTGAAS